MNFTISQPLLQTPQHSATQCFREPYEWALGAIFSMGGVARAALQQIGLASDFTLETAASLIAFYEALPISQKPCFTTTGIAKAREIKQWLEKGEGLPIISEITSLDLFGRRLTSIPPQIGLFIHLQNLDVSENPLKALPLELRNLSALQSLTMNDIPLLNLAAILPPGCRVVYLQEFIEEPQENGQSEIAETVRTLKTPIKPMTQRERVSLAKIVPDPKLLPIVTKLLQCTAFRTFWNQMLQEGMFHIRYATDHDVQVKYTGAFTNWDRSILLKEHLNLNELSDAIIFELGNLRHTKNLKAIEDFPDADTFADSREEMEYETWINAHELCVQLNKEGFIPEISYPYLTKQEYLALMQKNGHTGSYRADWYDACDPEAGEIWRTVMYKNRMQAEIAQARHSLIEPLEIIPPGESTDLSQIVPDPTLQQIITPFLRCDVFRNYWEQMLQEGTFRIRYATPVESSHLMRGPAATFKNRTILLRETMNPADLIAAILFELGNLTHPKPRLRDFPSADAYALYMENLEYETWRTAHRLEMGLLREGLLLKQSWPLITQEEYLAKQEKGGHTAGYRDDWNDACDS